MTPVHPSDSLAQRDAEVLILEAVAEFVGVPLAPMSISIEDGAHVEVDGASSDTSVLVEIYAHIGKVIGSQSKKLATDAFKLTWIGAKVGASRLVLAVIDLEVELYLKRPKAWLTAALRDSNVQVVRVGIDADAHARVEAAQRMQLMTGKADSAS